MLVPTPGTTNPTDGLLGRLLPQSLQKKIRPAVVPVDIRDVVAAQRALLLMRFTVVGAVSALLVSPFFVLFLDRPERGVFMLAYAGCLALTPVVLRIGGSVRFAAHWAVGCTLSLLAVESTALGGVHSSPTRGSRSYLVSASCSAAPARASSGHR